MASLQLLILFYHAIQTSQSLSCIPTIAPQSRSCNIDCRNSNCWHQTLDCNTNGSSLNCHIDCKDGCKDVIILAQNAPSLHIRGCNENPNSNILCDNMTIYCPEHDLDNISATDLPTCAIFGSNMVSSTIYTKNGFNDFQFINALAITDTRIFCGHTGTEHTCAVNVNGLECAHDAIDNTCNSVIPTANPIISPTNLQIISTTISPTIPPSISITDSPTFISTTIQPTYLPTLSPISISPTSKSKLTFYPTHRPTQVLTTELNEGQIPDGITTTVVYDVIANQNSSLGIYGLGMEILILSVVCFFLLMFCMLFCTLWLKRSEKQKLKINTNQTQHISHLHNANMYENRRRIYGNMANIALAPTHNHNRHRPQSINVNIDNISVKSGSHLQSPSMKNTYSDNSIISPRTHNAIMNAMVQLPGDGIINMTNNSDWEDRLTANDDLAFEDVMRGMKGTLGEEGDFKVNTNVQNDEFIIDEEGDVTPEGNN